MIDYGIQEYIVYDYQTQTQTNTILIKFNFRGGILIAAQLTTKDHLLNEGGDLLPNEEFLKRLKLVSSIIVGIRTPACSTFKVVVVGVACECRLLIVGGKKLPISRWLKIIITALLQTCVIGLLGLAIYT